MGGGLSCDLALTGSSLSDGESEPELSPEGRLSRLQSRASASYLNLTDNAYSLGGPLDMSPLSSPDKDGELSWHCSS